MYFFHTFFLAINILCAALVLLSPNPVHAIIFLILTFCCSACTLIFFFVDFLSLIFIVIYVGAIAILFLFIIMMIDVKGTTDTFSIFKLTIPFFLVTYLFFMFGLVFNQNDSINELSIETFDQLHNIELLGQLMYNYYLSCFLIAGIVLLIAIIGAVVLTLNFNSNRNNQLISRQLARSIDCLTLIPA